MRLFHVHPGALPTSLLSHQHQTAHLLLRCIADGKGHGGMARYNRHAGYVAWYHWLCVCEMLMRGLNHDSPVAADWVRIPAAQRGHDLYIPPNVYARDVQDLKAKIGSASKGGRMDDQRLNLQHGVMAFQMQHGLLRAAPLPPGALAC